MVNRIDTVEGWLYQLGLPRLDEQEALYLSSPAERDGVCEVFADLVLICDKRYKDNHFWPDFASLGLDCPMPQKPRSFRPRIFAVGIR